MFNNPSAPPHPHVYTGAEERWRERSEEEDNETGCCEEERTITARTCSSIRRVKELQVVSLVQLTFRPDPLQISTTEEERLDGHIEGEKGEKQWSVLKSSHVLSVS